MSSQPISNAWPYADPSFLAIDDEQDYHLFARWGSLCDEIQGPSVGNVFFGSEAAMLRLNRQPCQECLRRAKQEARQPTPIESVIAEAVHNLDLGGF